MFGTDSILLAGSGGILAPSFPAHWDYHLWGGDHCEGFSVGNGERDVGTDILKNIFRVYFEFDKLLVYCKHSSFNENNKCFLHAVYFTLMSIDRI